MKALHGADFHLGTTRYGRETPTGNSRLADYDRTFRRFVEAADEHDVDIVVIAGDLFDSRRPGPEALATAASGLAAITRTRPCIIVPGNHDGTTTVGDQRTHSLRWLASLDLPNLFVLTEPGWHDVDGLQVFALPYPHKRALDRELAAVPVDERAAAVAGRVEGAIRALSGERTGIFVGHVSVLGSKLGAESSMRFGWDTSIGAEVLEPFTAAMLGHIHRQQPVGPRAWYAGSPNYGDFSEVSHRKGFLLWPDVGGALASTVIHVRSNPRPMTSVVVVLGVGGGSGGSGDGPAAPPVPDETPMDGAIVLLTIISATRPSPEVIAALQADLRARGASYIKTDVRVDGQEVRPTVEVEAEGDTIDALARWLAANGHPEEPAMSAGRGLVAQID